MKLLKILSSTLILAASTAVAAADADGRFALKGAGFLPCSVYVTEREKRSDTYYLIGGWVEGYISAHNRLTPDTYDITSYESLELLLNVMQQHCVANPRDRLYPLLNAMLADLHSQRMRRESESVAIEEGRRKTVLYRDTIVRMQEELARRGLYKGPADGRFTQDTRDALMAFQSDLKFERTGFPDQATLWRLFKK